MDRPIKPVANFCFEISRGRSVWGFGRLWRVEEGVFVLNHKMSWQ